MRWQASVAHPTHHNPLLSLEQADIYTKRRGWRESRGKGNDWNSSLLSFFAQNTLPLLFFLSFVQHIPLSLPLLAKLLLPALTKHTDSYWVR